VRLYRTFVMREFAPVAAGRYMGRRLTVPTRLLVGDGDSVIKSPMIAGWEPHADHMSAELVPDTGHFIADERPDLVAAEARALFA
jgi:pimeloyl-ACP methyl ester carboxylesterase